MKNSDITYGTNDRPRTVTETSRHLNAADAFNCSLK